MVIGCSTWIRTTFRYGYHKEATNIVKYEQYIAPVVHTIKISDINPTLCIGFLIYNLHQLGEFTGWLEASKANGHFIDFLEKEPNLSELEARVLTI
jgi:hypothetical protein